MSDRFVPLGALVAEGVLDRELAAHLLVLLDAGVPLVVAGLERSARERVADALAAASPVPTGGEEAWVGPSAAFAWLADPAGVGCTAPGAGSAPRSPRVTRVRARGLLDAAVPEAPDPSSTRTLVRSLVRGFPLIADAAAVDLADLLARLRATPVRVPEDDLHRLGVVLLLDGIPPRASAAHLLRPSLGGSRRPPALLGARDRGSGTWDAFAWAAIPELAERCGVPHGAYAALLGERSALLG